MIRIKSEAEIAVLREGGRRLAAILDMLKRAARPGVSTASLDDLAFQKIKELGDEPALLNYQPKGAPWPYPATICSSINDEVVHGIPSADRVLKDGDVVGLDCTLKHQNLFTDAAITVPVGTISPEAQMLLEVTEKALAAGIKAVRPGNTTGDIGYAISEVAKKHGVGIIQDLCGHGVGYAVHEDPYVPNYGKRGTGAKLKAGMVIAVEPMFALGNGAVDFMPDGYTAKTADGSLTAHFEKTVVVTAKGAEILTP